MNKQEFLDRLRAELGGMPKEDREGRIAFYAEIIDDRIEEGLSEEDAVAELGSVEKIVEEILAETPISKLAKEKIKPKRRLSALEIVLLILGSPIWLSLLIAAIAVLFSLYAVLWSVIVSLWSVFAALAGSAIGCIAGGIIFICYANLLPGLALIAAGLVCAGVAIFAFLGCKAATAGIVILTKKIALGIKKCFVRKERTK